MSQVSGQVSQNGNKMHVQFTDMHNTQEVSSGRNVLVRVQADAKDQVSVGSVVLVRCDRNWREAKVRLEKEGQFKLHFLFSDGIRDTWLPTDSELIWNITPK